MTDGGGAWRVTTRFHGLRCAPGAVPSKRYGCVGGFKKAWKTACAKAGRRTHGGYVFHHTRNTTATNLRAGGMDEADAMKITGHQTAHVFRHYDLGNVEALRERLTRARAKAATIGRVDGSWQQRVVRQPAAESCTATAQQDASKRLKRTSGG